MSTQLHSIDDCLSFLDSAIFNALKELLSKKHLYQSVSVDTTDLDNFIKSPPHPKGVISQEISKTVECARSILLATWNIKDDKKVGTFPYPDYKKNVYVIFTIPHIKIFCPKCKRMEAHNPCNSAATSKNIDNIIAGQFGDNMSSAKQLLFFDFQCQSCKDTIVSFMIARKNNKLTLVGRYPMETVEVPSVIPKEQQDFFSSAVIAFNSGQTLPALFMLRTFVEQYVYAKCPTTNSTGANSGANSTGKSYADQVLTAYMDSLPADFKSRFPSLQDVYGRLSIAIHSAKSDAELFEKVVTELVKHFEAKKLYEIT